MGVKVASAHGWQPDHHPGPFSRNLGTLTSGTLWAPRACNGTDLPFSDNKIEPDKTDENYDWLQKMRAVFNWLIVSYPKYCSVTEHLQLMKSLCSSKVQCIPKTHKLFGMNLYKLCDYKEYTDNMTVFRQRWESSDSFPDSYTCNCKWTCCKDWKWGTQVVHGHSVFVSRIIWRFTY